MRWQYNQWDFGSKEGWQDYLKRATHPLTAFRIKSLAALLREKADSFARSQKSRQAGVSLVRSMADDLEGVAAILEDGGMQRLLQAEGVSTQLNMLAPRYKDSYVAQTEDFAASHGDMALMGKYAGEFDVLQGSSGVAITTILERNGRMVTGGYTYATSRGR